MSDLEDLAFEAREALDRFWFIQQIQFLDRTDDTISIRLLIRDDLFIQAFAGKLTNSLYFALIDKNYRIFGIDRESDHWHIHP